MKKLFKFLIIINLFLLLENCGGGWSDFKKTMSGQKVTSTDEFLIKKKDPLILPPEYEKLPIPKKNKKKSEQNTVENVLGSYKNTNDDTKASSNLENMILKELRK
tara:strand:- start:108 stop:422 length:315 start_codon:yes stop_codon:yes gene_type:complete